MSSKIQSILKFLQVAQNVFLHLVCSSQDLNKGYTLKLVAILHLIVPSTPTMSLIAEKTGLIVKMSHILGVFCLLSHGIV